MNAQTRSKSLWQALPLVGFFISEWRVWREEQMQPCSLLAPMPEDASVLQPYPLDMWHMLALPLGTLDEVGVPYNAATPKYPATYHPTTIAHYSLAHWNAYLATGDEKHKQAFLIQARWLVAHELLLTDDLGGWPLPFTMPDYYASGPWLSAMTQGEAISVLLRAYRLTGEDVFLQVASRAVNTFLLDIQDGGVSTSLNESGIFFEEVAVYPAAHILNGYLFALFGLYDYVAFTGDSSIETLIQRSLATLHVLIDGYDTGYWSHYDLLNGHLAPMVYHSLHIVQLEALARYSGCQHCAELAACWHKYQHSLICQLRYFIVSRLARYRRGLRRLGIRDAILHILGAKRQTTSKSVLIPIAAPSVKYLSSKNGKGD